MCRCSRKPRAVRSRESWRKDIEVRVRYKQLLRSVMAEQGYTASSLAREAGLSQQAVAFLLSEASWGRSSCSMDTALRITGALGVDLTVLFVPKTSTVRAGQRHEVSGAAA